MDSTTHRKCANPACARHVALSGGHVYCHHCAAAGFKTERPKQQTTVGVGIRIAEGITEGITESGNERTIVKGVNEHVRTLEDLIRVCEIDTDVWEIVEWWANKWEMGYKDASTQQPDSIPLFQIKARLRRKVLRIAAQEEIEALKEAAKRDMPARSKVARVRTSTGNMLEIDIFDLHLGKLAWSKETGYQNYDLKIARQLFEDALETLIQRTASHAFEQVVFPIGNDFFHTDNLASETTFGTRQDMDGRFHKSARIGREMMVYAIERLRQIAPVKAIVTLGNHDQLTAWHLGDSLECYFHADGDVAVNNLPALRKYIEFGKIMLMFTHGNRGKQADYPLLMATEQPDMWGRTRFREAHIGHWHKTQVNEQHGVRIRTISALCAVDAWHSEMTFVGQLRQAEAFVWNKDEGQIAHATYTAPGTFLGA